MNTNSLTRKSPKRNISMLRMENFTTKKRRNHQMQNPQMNQAEKKGRRLTIDVCSLRTVFTSQKRSSNTDAGRLAMTRWEKILQRWSYAFVCCRHRNISVGKWAKESKRMLQISRGKFTPRQMRWAAVLSLHRAFFSFFFPERNRLELDC